MIGKGKPTDDWQIIDLDVAEISDFYRQMSWSHGTCHSIVMKNILEPGNQMVAFTTWSNVSDMYAWRLNLENLIFWFEILSWQCVEKQIGGHSITKELCEPNAHIYRSLSKMALSKKMDMLSNSLDVKLPEFVIHSQWEHKRLSHGYSMFTNVCKH